MPDELAERSQRLKRRTFPYSLIAILLILCISGLGAAADPSGTLGFQAASWVDLHWMLAMAGTVVIGLCLLKQVGGIGENFELMNEILEAAEQERARRNEARQAAEQPPAAVVED